MLVGYSGTAVASPEPDANAQAVAADVIAAIGNTNDVIASASADSDSDSAASVTTEQTSVRVPRDPDHDIEIATADGEVAIGLPGAGSDAVDVDGTMVYEGTGSGVDTAVQLTTDGGVRVLVSIADASAPTEYRFPLDLPAGAAASLDDHGGVQLSSADGSSLGGFAPAWAKDANGVPLPSSYTLEGSVLVQHVQFDAGTAFPFPVIADPWYNPFSWNWSRIGRVTLNGLKKCGLGALGASVGLGAGTATTNILRNRAGQAMIRVAGGPYAYVGIAVAGCVAAQFS